MLNTEFQNRAPKIEIGNLEKPKSDT